MLFCCFFYKMVLEKKQLAYKPGSVLPGMEASAIYLRPMSPLASSVLPCSLGELPSSATIHELAASKMHSRSVATPLVGSCPTFSPLPPGRRLFSSALLNPRGLLPFSVVECSVLPGLSSSVFIRNASAADRPTAFELQRYTFFSKHNHTWLKNAVLY